MTISRREAHQGAKKGPGWLRVRPTGPFNREKRVLPESGYGRHIAATGPLRFTVRHDRVMFLAPGELRGSYVPGPNWVEHERHDLMQSACRSRRTRHLFFSIRPKAMVRRQLSFADRENGGGAGASNRL